MGHRDASGWVVDVQSNIQAKPDEYYNMLVSILGSTVMVANCDATYHQPYLGYWSVGCAQTFPVLQHGDESEKEVAWRKHLRKNDATASDG